MCFQVLAWAFYFVGQSLAICVWRGGSGSAITALGINLESGDTQGYGLATPYLKQLTGQKRTAKQNKIKMKNKKKNQDPLNQYEQSSNKLTESEVVNAGPAQVCTRSSVYTSWLPIECF